MVPSRGFTLIEIVVSLFIIGAVILLGNAILSAMPLSANARNQDLALKIAETELAELRALGYSGLPASGAFSDTLLSSLPSASGSYTVAASGATAKSVSVTVNWTEKTGTARSVTLTTLVAQTGGLP